MGKSIAGRKQGQKPKKITGLRVSAGRRKVLFQSSHRGGGEVATRIGTSTRTPASAETRQRR